MDDKLRAEVKEMVNKTVTAKVILLCALIGPFCGGIVGVGAYAYGSDKDYNAKSNQVMIKAIDDINMSMKLVVRGVDKIKYIERDVAMLTDRVSKIERNQNRNIAQEN